MNKSKLIAIVAMSAGFLSVHIMLSDVTSPSAERETSLVSSTYVGGYPNSGSAAPHKIPQPIPNTDSQLQGWGTQTDSSSPIWGFEEGKPSRGEEERTPSLYDIPREENRIDTDWQWEGSMFERERTLEEKVWEPSSMQTDTSWQYEGSMFEQEQNEDSGSSGWGWGSSDNSSSSGWGWGSSDNN